MCLFSAPIVHSHKFRQSFISVLEQRYKWRSTWYSDKTATKKRKAQTKRLEQKEGRKNEPCLFLFIYHLCSIIHKKFFQCLSIFCAVRPELQIAIFNTVAKHFWIHIFRRTFSIPFDICAYSRKQPTNFNISSFLQKIRFVVCAQPGDSGTFAYYVH